MLKNGTAIFFRVGNEVVEGTVVEPQFVAGSWEGYYICSENNSTIPLTLYQTDVYTDKAKLLWKIIDSLDMQIQRLENKRAEHYREVTKFQ